MPFRLEVKHGMVTTLAVGMIVLLVAADQLIKVWAVNSLAGIDAIPLIPGVLQFSYVENYGGAFGIFQGKAAILAAVTGFFLAVLLGAVIWFGRQKKYFLMWTLAMVVGGGIGNLIDRVMRGFVVDYIDFCLINYPVFNVADCFVVIGTISLMLFVFLSERKEERKKKAETSSGEQAGEQENSSSES